MGQNIIYYKMTISGGFIISAQDKENTERKTIKTQGFKLQ